MNLYGPGLICCSWEDHKIYWPTVRSPDVRMKWGGRYSDRWSARSEIVFCFKHYWWRQAGEWAQVPPTQYNRSQETWIEINHRLCSLVLIGDSPFYISFLIFWIKILRLYPQVYKKYGSILRRGGKQRWNEGDGRRKMLPRGSKSYYVLVLISVCIYSNVWMDIKWESAIPYLMCIILPDTRSKQSFQRSFKTDNSTAGCPAFDYKRKTFSSFISLLGSGKG